MSEISRVRKKGGAKTVEAKQPRRSRQNPNTFHKDNCLYTLTYPILS
jgi:hypothetical protein